MTTMDLVHFVRPDEPQVRTYSPLSVWPRGSQVFRGLFANRAFALQLLECYDGEPRMTPGIDVHSREATARAGQGVDVFRQGMPKGANFVMGATCPYMIEGQG